MSVEKKNKIADTIVMFFFGSVVGWVWEVICFFFVYGVFTKRGVLHGPWLPIYGIGFLLIILLKKYVGKRPVLFFAVSIAVCGFLEFITSLLLEALYHTRWWNYGNEVLNLKGRVCLKSLLFFGIAGSLIVYGIVPVLNKKVNQIAVNKKKIWAAIFLLIFITDLVVSIFTPNMGAGISESI